MGSGRACPEDKMEKRPAYAALSSMQPWHALAMWLFLSAVLGLYFLLRWYRDKQIVSKLTEKYVFITGCDSGFGNLLARQLDARGLRVLAACFTAQGAEELREHASERLQTTLLDVRSTDSVARATEWVRSQVGDKGLWGLVNNAGVSTFIAPNDWMTKEDFREVLDVNFLGLVDVTIHMMPLLRKARGRVVNMSSTVGQISMTGGGYSPSKYAVEAFSDSLRRENLVFGMKVSIIEPGYFITAMTNPVIDNFKSIWAQLPDETKRTYGESFFQKYLKLNTLLLSSRSSNLSLVTNCMEHALTAVHPHTRYRAGWDAKLVYSPVTYMPSWLIDRVYIWFYPKPEQSK